MKLYIKILITTISMIALTYVIAVFQEAQALPKELTLSQLGPFIVAMIAVFLIKDKDIDQKHFFIENKQSKSNYIKIFLMIMIPAAIGLLFVSYYIMFGGSNPNQSYNLILVVIWLPIGAFLEEVGWRLYLTKLVNKSLKNSYMMSNAFVGFIWMLSYVQTFSFGLEYIVGQTLLLVTTSVMIGELTKDHHMNIYFVTFTHILIDGILLIAMITNLYSVHYMLFVGILITIGGFSYIIMNKKPSVYMKNLKK